MPKIIDHDKYRKDLVDRCVDLFARQGLGGVTMRAIARTLGVSTGTLYHYFPGKQALFEAVARTVVDLELQRGREVLLEASEPAEAIVAYVAANEDRFTGQMLVLVDFVRAHGDDETLLSMLRDNQTRWYTAMSVLLGTKPENARAIHIYLRGVLLQRFVDGGRAPWNTHTPFVRALLEA